MAHHERHQERVVITGVAVACALGDSTEEVWQAVIAGEPGIRPLGRFDTSTLSCKYAAEMNDPQTPARRPRGRLDRATRAALRAAEEAVDAAHLTLDGLDPYRVGVALGTSVGGLEHGEAFHWELLAGGPESARRHHLLSYPLYTSADAVSITYGLKGPKTVISNACAAGANALGYAVDAIRDGRADVMLAGGVDPLDILSLAGFDSLQALDTDPCAPYSRSDGLSLGEGTAVFVLESESVATARNAHIEAYVRSYALTSDAHHATAPDPAGSGARRAMRRALDIAAIEPADVGYVNRHGTGTPANDKAELKAVDTLFGTEDAPPISSTKSQLGHTLGAAGAVEAAMCVLALRDGQLPPTINVDESTPAVRDVVPNKGRAQDVDVALSNSFAFGGNNCALVLSRRPGPSRTRADRRVVVTGAGVVSPLGIGHQAFLDALRSGQVGIAADESLANGHDGAALAAPVHDDLRPYVDRSYARRLDPLGMLTLTSARLALQDAGHKVTRSESERIGTVFGTGTGPLTTVQALSETIGTAGPQKVNPRLFPNSVMNAAIGHACLSLQVKGPLSTVATGCVAGLTAVAYAADLVRQGEADTMLAIGADEFTPLLHLGYDRLGVLTATGVRPYDRGRDGCALGSASVGLVVESLEHAQERGATILGELSGSALTSDAYRIAGNDPSGSAWAECFRRALDDAGLAAGDVGTVYGDARGAPVLDLAEARAVADVWRPGDVRLASVSGNVGHAHGATPMLSMVSALQTCSTGWAPDVAGLEDPVPEVAGFFDSPPEHDGRACLVSAANWGGTYSSLLVSPWQA